MTAVVSSRASVSVNPKFGIRSFSSGCRMRFRSNMLGSSSLCLIQSRLLCGISCTNAKSKRGSSLLPSADSSVPIGWMPSNPVIS